MEAVIRVINLSKYYKIYKKPQDKLKELIFRRNFSYIKKALENVSFEVYKGEAFGIIGENGAGKSTLLSIIAGILEPSRGGVILKGRVASILELGTGFHPELTGVENVFLYGNLMGISYEEIKEKLEFIKSFSELGDYIDKPIKTYSTGMIMRLAFATVLSLKPDIFIIDEALSVGDIYFQKKAFNKIREFKENGGTILFTSHSMYQVTNLCERALWLKDGKVVMIGNSLEVTQEYENYIREKSGEKELTEENNTHEYVFQEQKNNIAWIEKVALNKTELIPGDTISVSIKLKANTPTKAHIGILFRRKDGENIALYSTKHEDKTLYIGKEEFVTFVFEDFPLLYGDYFIDIYLADEHGNVFFDIKSLPIKVKKTNFLDIGVVKIKGKILEGACVVE